MFMCLLKRGPWLIMAAPRTPINTNTLRCVGLVPYWFYYKISMDFTEYYSNISDAIFITVPSNWVRCRPKSSTSQLFTQPFIQARNKEIVKALLHWSLWGDFTGDRWIPLPQKTSHAWNVSIWWRHHVFVACYWTKSPVSLYKNTMHKYNFYSEKQN